MVCATGPDPQPDPGPEDGDRRTDDPRSRLPFILIGAALVITIGALVTALVLAQRIISAGDEADTGPLAVATAPAPGAETRWCDDVIARLPAELADGPRRELMVAEPGVAAWGDPAVILRCGITDPAELTCAAPLTRVSDAAGRAVEWLRLTQGTAATFIAVDRPVRIAVTLPSSAGMAAIQDLTGVIADALPAEPVCIDGVLRPADNDG